MKVMTFLRSSLLAAAASAALCLAPPTQAGTLIATGYQVPGPLDFNINSPVRTGSVNAGAFAGTFDAVPIVFWCIQLNEYFSFGTTYNNYTSTLQNIPYFDKLGQLYNEAYAGATNNVTNSAAFQLAVWNIVYDSDSTVDSGLFSATGNTLADTNAINQANTWLAALSGFPDNFDTFWLRSDATTCPAGAQCENNQDFVTGVKTSRFDAPEPTPLLLIGAALVAMMVATRRREGKTQA
ncbi:MAG: PEP-CTERM sorting domain-containing protein [Aromatoleum sp.]|nr:PEP-CTERM sorting domain-containing protein [Aromatoleum sp.]